MLFLTKNVTSTNLYNIENLSNILFETYQSSFLTLNFKFDDVGFVHCTWVKVHLGFKSKFFSCVIKVSTPGHNVSTGVLGWISYKK